MDKCETQLIKSLETLTAHTNVIYKCLNKFSKRENWFLNHIITANVKLFCLTTQRYYKEIGKKTNKTERDFKILNDLQAYFKYTKCEKKSTKNVVDFCNKKIAHNDNEDVEIPQIYIEDINYICYVICYKYNTTGNFYNIFTRDLEEPLKVFIEKYNNVYEEYILKQKINEIPKILEIENWEYSELYSKHKVFSRRYKK